ncbi:P-loop containing nucleoside triphosphate hydrolase protein, partial [Baffinella frigidus]
MFGPDLASSSAVGNLDEARSGIVPRACSEVMAALEQRTTRGFAANLSVSYVEIYGEQVTDLLMEGAQVGLWHGVAHHAVYTGNCAQKVETVDQLRALLLKGDEAKRRAATAMNERSSRAHALLLFSLAQVHAETGVEVCSSLCLADLGGSEKVLKSQ